MNANAGNSHLLAQCCLPAGLHAPRHADVPDLKALDAELRGNAVKPQAHRSKGSQVRYRVSEIAAPTTMCPNTRFPYA